MERQKFGSDTRARILDTAEELFSSRGIAATSLRTLTRSAGVNLAAVHYHFGGKEALLDAVVARRAEQVNEERLLELERRSKEAGGAPSVEEILAAYVLPGRRRQHSLGSRDRTLSRLLARVHAQSPDLVEALTRKHFGPVMSRFVETLQKALPDVPAAEVGHRFRFTVGALLYVFSGNFDLDSIPGHPVQLADDETLTRQLISYLAAGLRARPAEGSGEVAAEQMVAAR